MGIKNAIKRVLGVENGNHSRELSSLRSEIKRLNQHIQSLNISVGALHSKLNMQNTSAFLDDIQSAEFKVFSQWSDDGIIQFLTTYLEIDDKRFVEFGVESYIECNTRFLLVNANWKGLVMDGSTSNMNRLKSEDIYWQYDITGLAEFVTKDNINDLLTKNGFTGEIGLLHIDIDGNDYWIWKEINVVNPVIVIVEYNSVFGPDHPWTIPYKSDFVRSREHFSNLYYGASLTSLCDMAKEKGYLFIGCNSNGNNAYFVRNDMKKDLTEKSVSEGFVESKFSESRNENGELTFIRGKDRLGLIKGLPVFNTRTKSMETIQ